MTPNVILQELVHEVIEDVVRGTAYVAFTHHLEASMFISVEHCGATFGLTSEVLGGTRSVDDVPIDVLVLVDDCLIFLIRYNKPVFGKP